MNLARALLFLLPFLALCKSGNSQLGAYQFLDEDVHDDLEHSPEVQANDLGDRSFWKDPFKKVKTWAKKTWNKITNKTPKTPPKPAPKPEWFQLRTKFDRNLKNPLAFEANPLTLANLTDEGWVQISSCKDKKTKFVNIFVWFLKLNDRI